MRISFISDLHTKHWQWEVANKDQLDNFYNSDVIVFSGDMSGRGYEHEVKNFLEWFNNLNKSAVKIFIAGNHDFFFDTEWYGRTRLGVNRHEAHNDLIQKDIEKLLSGYPDLIYLNDSGVTIEGIKFWGSPITPWFHDWAFNRLDDEIQSHWEKIPNDIDVLITHGPPFGIGDLLHPKFQILNKNKNVGCPHLLKEINRVKPIIHAFGHIHEGWGAYQQDDTLFINASCLDQDYKPVNAPIVVEIDLLTKAVTKL